MGEYFSARPSALRNLLKFKHTHGSMLKLREFITKLGLALWRWPIAGLGLVVFKPFFLHTIFEIALAVKHQ